MEIPASDMHGFRVNDWEGVGTGMQLCLLALPHR